MSYFKNMALSKEKAASKVEILESRYKAMVEEGNILRQELDQVKQQRAKFHEAKLAFLANGPHELRTPLNAILGLSQLLQRPQLENTRRLEFSRLIYKRGHDLLYFSSNLIEFLKIQSGQVTLIKGNVEISQLFGEITEAYNDAILGKENPEIVFNKEVAISKPFVIADYVRLRQVLLCLVRNAAQFTKTGTITVGCKDRPRDSKVIFYVSDTGIGIPASYRELIFKPFETVPGSISGSDGGVGLGLFICKELVACWGGEIWLDSIEGRGSVFYFTIPR